MHGYSYLCLPFLATAFNLALAIFLLRPPNASASLVPVQHEQIGGVSSSCVGDEEQEGSCASTYISTRNITIDGPISAEGDPHLRKMPGRDFKAYVRSDVSTFHSKETGSMKPSSPMFNGQAGKFVNLTPDRLGLYWDSGRGRGQFTGTVNGFEATGTATYPSHKFFFGKTDNPQEALCSFVVKAGTSVYYCNPYGEEIEGPASGVTKEARNSINLDHGSKIMYDKHMENIKFAQEYKEFTGGVEWLGMYPRDPPRHKIYTADYIGQVHHVQTSETQFIQMPPWDELPLIHPDARKEGDDIPLKKYRSPDTVLDITLNAVSCAPRVFEIENFISHTEADHILMLANRTHELHRSTTGDSGGRASDHESTRTSMNTWVRRHESPVIDSIYRRVAEVLEIDEALFRQRSSDEHPGLSTKQSIAEDLQMVHYDPGQEYTAHHDFGYRMMSKPHQPTRSINMLLYLNDVEEGGETSFPRWLNAETTGALNVKPKKGKAVLFYMILPDGNSDDLTQHAALPVIKGEKWMSNLWIWDPFKA